MRPYEGLFLVDEDAATENFQAIADHINGLLTRRGATVDKLEKWDSCRLTHEIRKKKRGTYILTKFRIDPAALRELRKDCQLSNVVMRVMLLREENVGTTVEAAFEAARAAKRLAHPTPESPTEPQQDAGTHEPLRPAPEAEGEQTLETEGPDLMSEDTFSDEITPDPEH